MGLPQVSDNCLYCGAKIRVMCRKGTDACSELCAQKLAVKETTTIKE